MRTHFQPPDTLNEEENKKLPIVCKHCKSENLRKEGYRDTTRRGRIQKYYCKDCQKYFTADLGFYRMKNSESIITMSLDMYISNLSSRKMRNQLKRHMSTKISHVSVMNWVYKYVKKISDYTQKLTPKIGGKIYADETFVKRQANNDVFWCSVDWGTRFINATLYSPLPQNVNDATDFMRRIKNSGNIKFVQTDALVKYPLAFRKAFSYHSTKNCKVKHIVNNVRKTGKHNVRIETVFSKIKDRVKDFRGFKALWSAPLLMAGIVIQHNYIEEHTTTRVFPCELAGLDLGEGVNRWLELIRLASFSK